MHALLHQYEYWLTSILVNRVVEFLFNITYNALMYKRDPKTIGKITIDPEIMVGKPVIAGTRIPVYMILDILASGETIKIILRDYYPDITEEDIKACLNYGARSLEHEHIEFIDTEKVHEANLR